MDNLTHTLIGVTVANAGLKQRFGPGTTWALAIASNITDIDVFWGFVHGGESFLYRRMLTHSVLGIPFLTVAGALIFSRLFKNLSFKTALGLFFLGTSLHVFFDLLNSFGVVILYPFDRTRFDLSWVFIIDLAIWFLLLLPLILTVVAFFRRILLRFSQVSLVALALYVALCGASRWRAEAMLANWTNRQTPAASLVRIFPEALGPHRFRGVVRLENQYHTFLIHTLSGKMEEKPVIVTEEANAEVQKINLSQEAKKLNWFFKAPVWKKGDSAGQWEVYDLQFQSEVVGRKNPFSYTFEIKGDEVFYLG